MIPKCLDKDGIGELVEVNKCLQNVHVKVISTTSITHIHIIGLYYPITQVIYHKKSNKLVVL